VDRHLDGGAVPVDHKIARIEDHEVELFHDELQALERLFLAAADSAQGVEVDRNMDHVTEVIGQIGCQPVEILRPPRIVDIAKDGPHRLRHDPPPWSPNESTLTRA
jgi:hypothetical protein